MTKQVLILCTGNSARSQMAEAIINARLAGEWAAVSAGTQPAPAVNLWALRALREIDLDAADAAPKHVDQFIGQRFDAVITVCDDANEACPVWPGQGKRLHIGFPDPAKAQGDDAAVMAVFRQVRDDIESRVVAALQALS